MATESTGRIPPDDSIERVPPVSPRPARRKAFLQFLRKRTYLSGKSTRSGKSAGLPRKSPGRSASGTTWVLVPPSVTRTADRPFSCRPNPGRFPFYPYAVRRMFEFVSQRLAQSASFESPEAGGG